MIIRSLDRLSIANQLNYYFVNIGPSLAIEAHSRSGRQGGGTGLLFKTISRLLRSPVVNVNHSNTRNGKLLRDYGEYILLSCADQHIL